MKTRNRLCSIVVALFFLSFICATASADTAQGTETQITTNTSNQLNPDIYGERIVWQDDRNGSYDAYIYDPNWDIYIYDLSSSIETQITTNESNQSGPVIYGDRIVWTDDRNGNYDVYMYDLSSSTETQITISESNQSDPAIYEDRIVWADDRNGNTDIYMYDLSSSTETQITTNESNQSDPAIYGDRIIWTDDRNGIADIYTPDVYMYNLSTFTETQIAGSEGFFEYGPAIYGDRIVYMSEGAGDLVWMYDLSTSELTFIAYDAWNPVIYGERIVWMYGMGSSDIYMYDLSTSREIQITSDESVHQSAPAIYGDRIVWEDWRNENSDIYMFTLDSAKLTPLEKMKDLTEYVENTYKCHVKTKTGLATLLDRSKCFYEKGEDAKAVSMLKSFIHLAEKMKVCKQISAGEADYMVKEAKRIIDQIQTQQR
jgi:beta propeller repeat protein